MRTLLALIAAAVLLSPLPVLAQPAEEANNVATFSHGDLGMEKAKAEAIRFLPQFWRRYDADPAVREMAVVKAGFRAKDGREEFMWVLVLSRKDGMVTGRLANSPVLEVGVKAGDTVTIDEKRIVDWGYRRDGVRWGFFSGREQIARLSPDKQAEALAGANFSPTPIEP